MPRRWLTIALFALALAVQALAPVVNRVATAHEAGLFETCLTADDHAPQKAPSGGRRHHHCALCQSFCDGVAPVAARPVSLGSGPLHWSWINWAPAVAVVRPATPDFAHRARAPPRFV